MSATKKSKVELEVIIPEIILNENPDLKKNYKFDKTSSKGTITYEIENSIPKEFTEKLQELVPSFHDNEIVTFNPLVFAVNELQSIKEIKYNPEDLVASERAYIDSGKIIGSFNSSLTKAKKQLKEPHTEFNRKVDAIFKVFESEGTNSRNSLDENFKPLLEKREAEKKAKEDKKREQDLKAMADLSSTNSALEEQLKEQTLVATKSEIDKSLGSIVANVAIKIPTLNKGGLEELLAVIEKLDFTSYVGYEKQGVLDNILIESYKSTFQANKRAAVQNLELAIKAIDDANQNQTLQTENAVMQAQMPDLTSADDDLPFKEGAPVFQQELTAPALLDDCDKFGCITNRNNEIVDSYKAMIEQAKSLQFDDPGISRVRDVLVNEQFPKMLEWLEKLAVFTNTKQQQINIHFNK